MKVKCHSNIPEFLNLMIQQDPIITEVFKAIVGGKFAALNLVEYDVTGNVKEVLLSTVQEVLGYRRKKK